MKTASVPGSHVPTLLTSRPHVTTRQILAAAVAVTAVLAATLGLFVPGVYGTDEASVQMLRGFDAVTLLVGPALLLAVLADSRGSVTGRVIVASLLAYLGYTYAYHLLGVGLTDLMLLARPALHRHLRHAGTGVLGTFRLPA